MSGRTRRKAYRAPRDLSQSYAEYLDYSAIGIAIALEATYQGTYGIATYGTREEMLLTLRRNIANKRILSAGLKHLIGKR